MILRTAPDPHLGEGADFGQGPEVRPRLYAAAQNRKHLRPSGNKVIDGYGRYRGRPHLSNEPSVHTYERLSGFGAKQLDRRHMGVLVKFCVGGVESDHLGAHHLVIDCRHHAEPSAVARHGENHAQRLMHAAGGIVDQRFPDCGDQVMVGE